MSSETRQVPRSNKTRKAALDTGKAKNVAMGASSFISAATVLLLNAIQLLYGGAMKAVSSAKAVFFNSVSTKDKKRVALEMICSHFIQVFVFGVKRGVFSAGDLAYYDLTEGGELPDMRTDAKLLAVAENLVSGDAKRMLVAGAVAMAMPAITEVSSATTDFETAGTTVNNSAQALKDAQAACNALNKQADDCIKLLWGEVETKNVNLPRPTLRANSALWGVIYDRVGGTKVITGTVKDSVSGLPISDVTISFVNGNNEADSDGSGYKLDTTLMDVQDLVAEHPLYTTLTTSVTLVEGEDQVVNIVLVLKP